MQNSPTSILKGFLWKKIKSRRKLTPTTHPPRCRPDGTIFDKFSSAKTCFWCGHVVWDLVGFALGFWLIVPPWTPIPWFWPLTHVMTCEKLQSGGWVVRTRTRVKSWILEKADEGRSFLTSLPHHDDVIPKYSTSVNVFKWWLDASAQLGLQIKMKDFRSNILKIPTSNIFLGDVSSQSCNWLSLLHNDPSSCRFGLHAWISSETMRRIRKSIHNLATAVATSFSANSGQYLAGCADFSWYFVLAFLQYLSFYRPA